MKTASTPLVDLLDQRWKDMIQKLPDVTAERPFKRPVYFDAAIPMASVRAHAEANNSDPYAGRRARLYVRQGYWLASDTLQDAHALTAARRGQGVTFPTVRLT